MKQISSIRVSMFTGVICAVFLALGAVDVLNSQSSGGGLSRAMDQGIRLYHDGKDNAAMDKFMEILVQGTPAEKALANDYINKITLRMNTGVQTINERKSPAYGGESPEGAGEAVPADEQPEIGPSAPASVPEKSVSGGQYSKEDINQKISEKIAEMRRNLLMELGQHDQVKVYMRENMPVAISLDPDFFFANETVFTPAAMKILPNIAGLIYTVGKAGCMILPEGSIEGDVKIKSIRRAIALNSYLASNGIAQARLDVNLTGTGIRLPRDVTNIGGMIILLDYEKEPRIKDLEDMQSKGPKVSLGVYPGVVSIEKGEGAILEFSVLESPSGKPSWRFQIFHVQSDGNLARIQEVSGYGAQCSQSFWNGRKNFFGAPYQPGKYLFTVSAKDVEGRETEVKRALTLRTTAKQEEKIEKQASESKKLNVKEIRRVQSEDGAMSPEPTRKVLKKGVLPKKGKKAARIKGKKAVPVKADAPVEKTAPADDAPPSEAPQTEVSAQVSYKIYFKEDATTITANSEKKLAQVAETMSYYPMAKIKIVGYAYSGEANSQAVAAARAEQVASRLTTKHKIEKDRINVATQISDTPKSVVEIRMSGNE